MYEVFEHTADLGLRVRAADLDALFAEAGRGLFEIIAGDLSGIQPLVRETIELAGDEVDYLLFDWLNELLYAFESRRMLFVDFQVQVSETGLWAVAAGEPWDPDRHRLEHEVKAVTYHGLSVQHNDGQWQAEVILDI